MNEQLAITFNEVNEINEEDLQASADKFDDMKANPDKYFEKKQDNSKIIQSLRKSAQSCTSKAEKINTEVSGNWTYRRQRFADSAQKKKDNLLKDALALNRLANLWEENNCPEILKGIRSASDFDIYYPKAPDNDCPIGGWYREEYPGKLKRALRIGLKMPSDNMFFKDAIKELSEIVFSQEEIKARKLKEELVKIRSANIPGFFPTPDELIDKMIEYAEIEHFNKILEPSAGLGNILDKIKEHGYDVDMFAVEQQYSLFKILELKGYENIACGDILTDPVINDPERTDLIFDRILMNPPFEKSQDIDHVLHCYNKFLKKDGILVSIMSAGVMTNTAKKFEEFRSFIQEKGAQVIINGQMFKDAFNSTGVSTITLIIKK